MIGHSYSYLNTAAILIQEYKGTHPFHTYLKNYFKEHKKHGSRDRKIIANLCFSYFRLGWAFQDQTQEERILTGVFLCSEAPNSILEELRPEWNNRIALDVDSKLNIIGASLLLTDLFPFIDELSEEINTSPFIHSFFIQPDLFIRCRPGKEEHVTNRLTAAQIPFDLLYGSCIRLGNSTPIDALVEMDKDAVVQDLNSQRILDGLMGVLNDEGIYRVWDCCAASGGKSILFHDKFPFAHLTVSDIRQSVLTNLQKRFQRAGINDYRSFGADVSNRDLVIPDSFDLVLADVPCTGSGTWSRTPEQLCFFNQKKINSYAALQESIAANATKALKDGGYLLYSTCSVFKRENEGVVRFLQRKGLKLIHTAYYKGYEQRADTLFAALFRKL